MTSGRLYSAVTKHWTKIASGLVVVLGVVEFVWGGLTADSGVEFYLMAWAGTTGGLWFLFEKAETTLSEESRGQVKGFLQVSAVKSRIESIPSQFVVLFDRVFGERHWSKRCFKNTAVTSVTAGMVVFGVLLATGEAGRVPSLRLVFLGAAGFALFAGYFRYRVLPRSKRPRVVQGAVGTLCALLGMGFWPVYFNAADLPSWLVGAYYGITAFAFFTLLNLLPDYVSLLETRWAVSHLAKGSKYVPVLLLDVVLTWAIWAVALAGFLTVVPHPSGSSDDGLSRAMSTFWQGLALPEEPLTLLSPPALFRWLFQVPRTATFDTPVKISFFSTFFTSIWLWLYAASVLVSRVLLKMNSGVGFLLRVTDVERQPFRSMGFVSVIIVSVLFLLGLPLVLL